MKIIDEKADKGLEKQRENLGGKRKKMGSDKKIKEKEEKQFKLLQRKG